MLAKKRFLTCKLLSVIIQYKFNHLFSQTFTRSPCDHSSRISLDGQDRMEVSGERPPHQETMATSLKQGDARSGRLIRQVQLS